MGAAGPEWVRPAGSPQRGQASYYGPEFTGRKMANGRRFNPRSAVVAHRTLPLGTTVLVKNLSNGRATTATVEDRGPYIHGRIVDLTPRLAEHLGMVRQGLAPVEVMPVEVAEAPDPVEPGPCRRRRRWRSGRAAASSPAGARSRPRTRGLRHCGEPPVTPTIAGRGSPPSECRLRQPGHPAIARTSAGLCPASRSARRRRRPVALGQPPARPARAAAR